MANREIQSTINNVNQRIRNVENSSSNQSVEILALQTDTTTNNGISQIVRTDAAGKVVSQILPSYIDDVLEFPTFGAFPALGQVSKIYVATDEPLKSWRWSGSTYIDVSGGINLNETSSTSDSAGRKGGGDDWPARARTARRAR